MPFCSFSDNHEDENEVAVKGSLLLAATDDLNQ